MKGSLFRTRADFERQDGTYQLLPLRFLRRADRTVLITNEAGEYDVLADASFTALVSHTLVGPERDRLKSKHFLSEQDSRLPLSLLATKIRTKRSFLAGFTRLHIFVVTLRCDHTCPYCQVSRVTQDRQRFDMSPEVADRAVEWAFRSPAKELKIEFQGGEPTLNLPIIRRVVENAVARAEQSERQVEFVIATNLSELSEEMLAFAKLHRILISTSLDGPADLHNANRPRPGRDSYERFSANLTRARQALGFDRVSALMTTTPASLGRATDIIDEYQKLGFSEICLRPISPYGFARRTHLDTAYTAGDFLSFFEAGLNYIIELNRLGKPMVELYSQMLLRKILTPFPVGYVDLQSPAAAGTGVLVYNYEGGVYASDESRMLAEMGDESFRLGDVRNDAYEAVMSGPRVRALVESSCLESTPGCSDCAYLPYCGSDPVHSWVTQADPVGHRPSSEFCARHMGMFRLLFDHLESSDTFVKRLFWAWAAQPS